MPPKETAAVQSTKQLLSLLSHRQNIAEPRVEDGDELGVGVPEAVVDKVTEGGAVVGESHVLLGQVHPLVSVQLDGVFVR